VITASIDVETSKIPRFRPWQPGSFLVSVGMAWQDRRTRVWVLNHNEVANVNQRAVLDEIQHELNGVDRLVGHNLKFDLQWLRHVGLKLDHLKMYCTQVAEYLIRGQQKISYHLADVSQRYGITPKIDRVKIFWNAGYETDEIPLHILNPYLEQDCINALAIFQRQVPLITAKRLQHLVSLQMELMDLLSQMESTGLLVDVEKAQALYAQMQEQLKEVEFRLRDAFDRPDLNLASGQELSAALYGGNLKREIDEEYVTTRNAIRREPYIFEYADKRKGSVVKYRNVPYKEEVVKTRKAVQLIELPRIFTPLKDTELKIPREGGYYQTDKNTLKQLKGKTKKQQEILALLDTYSKVGKAAETFIGDREGTGILGKLMPDNRVHPSFNQTIAATGRLTSSSPNGQNLPRKGTSPIKRIFVPRFDLIGNGDLAQLEWRVAAFLSQDPVAMQEIIDDVDYHRDNAIKFFGADPSLPSDHPKFAPIRTTAKVFGFRLLYGGSAFGMYADQNMPNFPIKKWEAIVTAYYEKYKVLQAWQEDNVRLVHDNGGWLQLPTGRILHFPRLARPNKDGYVYNINTIKNYPVQSMATADITPLAMTVIAKRMQQAQCRSLFILQVHDSIVFDLVASEVPTVASIVLRTFNELPDLIERFWGFHMNVPLTGDFEIGPNYGELTKYKGE